MRLFDIKFDWFCLGVNNPRRFNLFDEAQVKRHTFTPESFANFHLKSNRNSPFESSIVYNCSEHDIFIFLYANKVSFLALAAAAAAYTTDVMG